MGNLFTKHPHAVGETYLGHMFYALGFAVMCLLAATAITIHSVFPFLFEFTGCNLITKLYNRLSPRKERAQGYSDG